MEGRKKQEKASRPTGRELDYHDSKLTPSLPPSLPISRSLMTAPLEEVLTEEHVKGKEFLNTEFLLTLVVVSKGGRKGGRKGGGEGTSAAQPLDMDKKGG